MAVSLKGDVVVTYSTNRRRTTQRPAQTYTILTHQHTVIHFLIFIFLFHSCFIRLVLLFFQLMGLVLNV